MHLDFIALEHRLQCLDRGVVAAGLITDCYWDIGEVFRPANLRIWCDKDSCGRHRVSSAPETSVPCRGRHVDGPMAGGADVTGAAILNGLVRAADLVLRQFR